MRKSKTENSRTEIMQIEADSVKKRHINNCYIPKDLLVDEGLCLIVGRSGTGKSLFLNNLRNNWLMDGYKGISIDFENTANKLVNPGSKRVINFSNKNNFEKLDLFNIRPQAGEIFQKDELNKEGLPIYRFKLVREILKTFSLYCYNTETKAYVIPKLDELFDEAIN